MTSSLFHASCSGFLVISPEYPLSPSHERRSPSVTAAARASGLRRAYSVRLNGAASAHTACAWPFLGFSTITLGSIPSCSHRAIARAFASSMSTTSRSLTVLGFASMYR